MKISKQVKNTLDLIDFDFNYVAEFLDEACSDYTDDFDKGYRRYDFNDDSALILYDDCIKLAE